eukprot:GHVL01024206.1.p1 GENE.GHVL01024206.1~~GHVL01024206.1.p1  ORF type:complete len:578 (-),score=91.06 GHVL01024206.1:948-2648(-)
MGNAVENVRSKISSSKVDSRAYRKESDLNRSPRSQLRTPSFSKSFDHSSTANGNIPLTQLADNLESSILHRLDVEINTLLAEFQPRWAQLRRHYQKLITTWLKNNPQDEEEASLRAMINDTASAEDIVQLHGALAEATSKGMSLPSSLLSIAGTIFALRKKLFILKEMKNSVHTRDGVQLDNSIREAGVENIIPLEEIETLRRVWTEIELLALDEIERFNDLKKRLSFACNSEDQETLQDIIKEIDNLQPSIRSLLAQNLAYAKLKLQSLYQKGSAPSPSAASRVSSSPTSAKHRDFPDSPKRPAEHSQSNPQRSGAYSFVTPPYGVYSSMPSPRFHEKHSPRFDMRPPDTTPMHEPQSPPFQSKKRSESGESTGRNQSPSHSPNNSRFNGGSTPKAQSGRTPRDTPIFSTDPSPQQKPSHHANHRPPPPQFEQESSFRPRPPPTYNSRYQAPPPPPPTDFGRPKPPSEKPPTEPQPSSGYHKKKQYNGSSHRVPPVPPPTVPVSRRNEHLQMLGFNKGTFPTQVQIKGAYKKCALQWHPDRNHDKQEEAKTKFQKIVAAYEYLTA